MANYDIKLPALADLQRYNVNRPNDYEGIKSVLYDFQTYAQAGQSGLDFFQVPQGQGGKTLADTNMESAGSLPNPKHFLVTNIQVYFTPGVPVAAFGAQGVAAYLNDVQALANSGYLEFFIGSKNYVQEGPIGVFPPRTGLIVSSSVADQTTAAADSQSRIAYGNLGGAIYQLTPPILLTPTQNFRVSMRWPTAVSVSAAARIGVRMEGILYRLSQ